MDLRTSYLGLSLAHPLVASASPLSRDLDGIRRLEDAGAAAIVMHSLFEEQIEAEARALDHDQSYGTHAHAEALTYFPEPEAFVLTPDAYLELVRAAKAAVDVPIVGSLNGVSTGGWTHYARLVEEAGADALELNLYRLPADLRTSAAEVEAEYLDVVRAVAAEASIPLAVKIGPYFSATGNMVARLGEAGARGAVLFNRFYGPDIDLEALEVVPALELSRSHDLRLPLRWIAILYGRVDLDLALTSGVHGHEDVVKGLLAGAAVTMATSELLQRGTGRLAEIRTALADWLERHEYDSVAQMRGSMSLMNVADPAAFERANYMKVLQSWQPAPSGLRAVR